MDHYLDRLKNGTLRLHALEKELPVQEAVRVRRAFIEQDTGVLLPRIGDFTFDPSRAVQRNIENMIGAVQIPLGVAGPLHLRGEYAQGQFWLPLATTEGALVASVNRGCAAVARAGGAVVRLLREGMTRAPAFAARDVAHAVEVVRWVEGNLPRLQEAAAATTSHGRLTGAACYVAGPTVFVRLEYDTKDAMGMNMVTLASEKAADVIEKETGARLIALSGNMCTDKKPAAINMIQGRGKTVVAGIQIPEGVVQEVFKTTGPALADVNYRKNLLGSARAGSLGFNAQAANVIAALYLACGQDAAHVVEGSSCITTVEQVGDGVYVSATLPAVQVGTVGGGTGLDTQREALALLGVAGGGDPPGSHARKFAEIVAGGVLAGELSLLGALAAHHLARAHRDLGRGKA